MNHDEEVDRAYVHGYEQASREWSACLKEISASLNEKAYARISDADIKKRNEALAAVRNRIRRP